MVAVSGERSDEANGGESISGDEFFVGVIAEDICVGGISIEIEDDGRFFYSRGFHDVEVDGISPAPLDAEKFDRVAGIVAADLQRKRMNRHEMAGGQGGRSPIFFDGLEAMIVGISDGRGSALKLSGGVLG